MGKVKNLQLLEDEEYIARIIFSPSMIHNGEISPSAFSLTIMKSGVPEDYLSVWRLKLRIPDQENVKSIPPRTEGDCAFGYASFTVGSCHSIRVREYRCEAKVNPRSKNLFHAGLYYTNNSVPIVGSCFAPEFLMMTTLLAANAQLVAI